MSIICFMLTFLSSFIRLIVTMDTIEKEDKLAKGLEIETEEGNEGEDATAEGKSGKMGNNPRLEVSKYENT